MIKIGHSRAAYLLSIALLLLLIYIYDIYIVSGRNVSYSEELFVGLSIFISTVILIFIWSISIYFKYIIVINEYSILIFKLIAIFSSIFLIYFGSQTLRIDEIVSSENDRHNSYEYLATKDLNDLASIFSILIGIGSSIAIILF